MEEVLKRAAAKVSRGWPLTPDESAALNKWRDVNGYSRFGKVEFIAERVFDEKDNLESSSGKYEFAGKNQFLKAIGQIEDSTGEATKEKAQPPGIRSQGSIGLRDIGRYLAAETVKGVGMGNTYSKIIATNEQKKSADDAVDRFFGREPEPEEKRRFIYDEPEENLTEAEKYTRRHSAMHQLRNGALGEYGKYVGNGINNYAKNSSLIDLPFDFITLAGTLASLGTAAPHLTTAMGGAKGFTKGLIKASPKIASKLYDDAYKLIYNAPKLNARSLLNLTDNGDFALRSTDNISLGNTFKEEALNFFNSLRGTKPKAPSIISSGEEVLHPFSLKTTARDFLGKLTAISLAKRTAKKLLPEWVEVGAHEVSEKYEDNGKK